MVGPCAVKVRQMRPDAAQIEMPINQPQQVISRDMIFQTKLVKQCRLRFLPRPHHRKSSRSMPEVNQRVVHRLSTSFFNNISSLRTIAPGACWFRVAVVLGLLHPMSALSFFFP